MTLKEILRELHVGYAVVYSMIVLYCPWAGMETCVNLVLIAGVSHLLTEALVHLWWRDR
jgi:hypothetical protein